MNAEIAKSWVAALRSGEYTQGIGGLRPADTGEPVTHCCLGVLCDLYQKSTGKGRWNGPLFEVSSKIVCSGLPPNDVVEWAGMEWANPGIKPGEPSLAELNDAGNSFVEIADLIEKYSPGF